MRISKYLSLCGVTSRRGAEILVSEGKVTINDSTVEKPGTIVKVDSDRVKVNGTLVVPVEEKVYIVLNKPAKSLTTLFDPFKRRTILDFVKTLKQRVYPIGRLDQDTEGVILLSNDGDLVFRLAHPKYQINRVYEAIVLGHFSVEAGKKIARGIKLDDGATGRADVSILGYPKNQTRLRLVLQQGRKREVKQLCRKVGYPVQKLRRVEFASITAKGLSFGKWRHLTLAEVRLLRRMVGLDSIED